MIYFAVVSFILGIVFEKIFDFGWSIALLAGLISITVFLFSFRSENQGHSFWGNFQRVSLIFFAIGVAFALGILRMNFVDISPDPTLSNLVGQKISFEAVISDEPDIRDSSTRYTVMTNQNSLSGYSQKCTDIFLLENSSCSPQSGSQGISGNIHSKNFDSSILLIADRFPEFKYGDKIRVSGKLDLPKNFLTDTGAEFDYTSYLSKDKIHFLIYRPGIKKIGNEGNKIISFLYSIKNVFINKISAVVPEPNSSLLGGVIFGAKQSLGQELLDDFRKAGLIHIVVLSGYNITIIAIGIFYLTSFLGKRNLGFILSAIFIVLFATMVGLGATVIRACVMALIAILAKFLGRPADALRWLFIAGLLMLLWNPLILFYDPSFQLSFMATLGLILFSPFVMSFISNHKIQKFIPIKFGIREIVASTLAVQFFVLPLLIRMSGFISLISFVVNPLVLPLVPWAMAFGALTGALGIVPWLGPILSWPFGVVAYFISQIMITVTEFSASIPFATIQTNALSLWLIFIWYLAYGFIYFKIKTPPALRVPSP